MRLLDFFKKLFTWLKPKSKETSETYIPREILPPISSRDRVVFVPKAGSQITSKDYGKFMKHGKQSSWYRGTVRKKKKIENED